MNDFDTNRSVVEHLEEQCEQDKERHIEAQIALGWACKMTDILRGLYSNEPTYEIDEAALEKNIEEQFDLLFPFLVGLVRPCVEFPYSPVEQVVCPTVSIAKMSAVDRLGQIT